MIPVPNVPAEVSVKSRTETSLEVKWKAPQDETTVFTGYNVYVDGTFHVHVRKDVTRTITIDRQTANTEYVITLRTVVRHTVLGAEKDQESYNSTITEWTCKLAYHKNLYQNYVHIKILLQTYLKNLIFYKLFSSSFVSFMILKNQNQN